MSRRCTKCGAVKPLGGFGERVLSALMDAGADRAGSTLELTGADSWDLVGAHLEAQFEAGMKSYPYTRRGAWTLRGKGVA